MKKLIKLSIKEELLTKWAMFQKVNGKKLWGQSLEKVPGPRRNEKFCRLQWIFFFLDIPSDIMFSV